MLLRLILIILTIWSFIPQISLTVSNKSCEGLSLVHVLFNAISATEQLALGLHLIILEPESLLHHEPPTANDWLDIAQFGVVWGGQMILLACGIWLPPASTVQKTFVAMTFAAFLSISLAFVAYMDTLPRKPGNIYNDGRIIRAGFTGIHTMFVNPVVTSLIFTSFWAQLRQPRTSSSAISVSGLALQAFVFAAVGVSWAFRLQLPDEYSHAHGQVVPFQTWIVIWYQLVGWATVNNLLFASVHITLFCIMARHSFVAVQVGESAPLLGV